jgi:hypothetical protein
MKKSVPKGIVHTNWVEIARHLHKNPPLLSFEEWGIILENLEGGIDPVDASDDSYLFAEATKILYEKLMKDGKS